MGGVAEMAGAPTAENSIPTPPSSNRNLQSIHAASSSPDQKKNLEKNTMGINFHSNTNFSDLCLLRKIHVKLSFH